MNFSKRLVLNQYMLSLFGFDTLDALSEPLKSAALEQLDHDNVSWMHKALVEHLPAHSALNADALLTYDQNIVRHTRQINRRRVRPIRWKYFQYLALLFVEVFLDHYFRDPAALLVTLNAHIDRFNGDKNEADHIGHYTIKCLNKLAFWSATGSGKTLLMHINILQYRHHLARFGRGRALDRVILLTPNEGLSHQHLDELRASGIDAAIFDPLRRRRLTHLTVEIIDIHKLREDQGEKTVAVEAFEGSNLVLVDEGHRGAGGHEWMDRRNRLCEDGFSFEYSATFGQAMRAAKKKAQADEYARCILFDYSYSYFYADGYGKDYRILNLGDDSNEETRALYLTAALLTFYQQVRLYHDKRAELRAFLLAKPLWLFVGGSVTKSTSKKDISDIEDILLFLARFVEDHQTSVHRIERIISGNSGLLNKRERELFPVTFFEHVASLNMTAEGLYRDILEAVFNASGGGKLHVERREGAGGEIALRLGEHDPFGVIHVSSVKKLCGRCEAHREMVVSEREFGESLFRGLNDEESSLNLLVGAKKFTEGWSSWRVSSMGLMNIGRREGAQIIQLFGRGVRLRGHDFGLKRSSACADLEAPRGVSTLETLNIFGVRANYMRQFKDYLEEEGLPAQGSPIDAAIPRGALEVESAARAGNLRGQYRQQAPALRLGAPPERLKPVVLDWYPKIQAAQSAGGYDATFASSRETGKLTSQHVAFMNLDEIFFELARFKRERGWYNFNLTLDDIRSLLEDGSWYTLFIPPSELDATSFSRVLRWQELAIVLLKKYCDRYDKFHRDEWERSRS